MFAINPLVNKYGEISYLIFGIGISINFIYLVFCSLLGCSVYFYAIGLVGEKAFFEYSNKIGHVTYALALISPPLFIILYPVSITVTFVVEFTKSLAFSKFIESALSSSVVGTATFISGFIFKTFLQKDKSEKVEKLANQENQLLTRSKELYDQNYYDLALIESWKSIEISLRKAFISIGEKHQPKTMRAIIGLAISKKLITHNQGVELIEISKIRNEAVHSERNVNQEEASRALILSEKIIAYLEGANDFCYFCNKTFQVKNLKHDDFTGASVCPECAKANPNWEDELSAMGMDP